MAPTPFPQSDSAPGTNQDFILIIILLGLMLFFLVRSIGKFSSAGLKVSRSSGKTKESGDEGATTTAGEEEDEEEEDEDGAAAKED